MAKMKRLAIFNQAPAKLHNDIAKAFQKSGIPLRQIVAATGSELSSLDVPTTFGCTRNTRSALSRLFTWCRFTLTAFWCMARYRKDFGFLVTNPPFVPWIAPFAKKLFGFHYSILMYDLYPDLMVSLRMLRSGTFFHRVLKRLNAFSLQNADAIITIGRCMKRTTEAYLNDINSPPVHVIHNWADIQSIRPIPKEENPFATQHGLVGKFVVMYSGNWSPTHGLDLIVELADAFRDRTALHFVLIGNGGCKAEIVADANKRDLPNLTILDYLPSDQFRYSIAAADCQIVSLDEAFFGISVPSKTYSALAAGCALIAITPEGTELQAIVEEFECGRRIRSRDLNALRDVILGYEENRERLAMHKQNARNAAEHAFNPETCTQQYIDVLEPFVRED